MRLIGIVLVLAAVLVLAMLSLHGAAKQTAGGSSLAPYAHDIQAAQNLVHTPTSPTP